MQRRRIAVDALEVWTSPRSGVLEQLEVDKNKDWMQDSQVQRSCRLHTLCNETLQFSRESQWKGESFHPNLQLILSTTCRSTTCNGLEYFRASLHNGSRWISSPLSSASCPSMRLCLGKNAGFREGRSLLPGKGGCSERTVRI